MSASAEWPSQAAEPASSQATVWRDAIPDDAEPISAVEHRVHALAPERIEVHREKIRLFGAGCRVLVTGSRVVGYGLAYPWRLDDVPPLDRFLAAIPPDAACLFLHDVAILPEARASGASRNFVDHAVRIAEREGLARLALVSVYGTDVLWRRHGFAPSLSAATGQQLRPYGTTALYMTRRLQDIGPIEDLRTR